MEEEKKKQIEAKLSLLLAQMDEHQSSDNPERKEVNGIRLIRRRKGNPDKHIS